MDFEKTAEELRVEAKRTEGRGPRAPFTRAFKARVVDYFRARAAQGVGQSVVAAELGLSDRTMGRWCRKAGKARAFRAVTVDAPAATSRGLVVFGPGGLRVVGLDVTALAVLLRTQS